MAQYNFVWSRSLGCYHSGFSNMSTASLLRRSDAAAARRQKERKEVLDLLRPLFIDGVSDAWLLYYARERGLITASEYDRWA